MYKLADKKQRAAALKAASIAEALAVAARQRDPVARKLMLLGVCRRARWSRLFTSAQVNRMRTRACIGAQS